MSFDPPDRNTAGLAPFLMRGRVRTQLKHAGLLTHENCNIFMLF